MQPSQRRCKPRDPARLKRAVGPVKVNDFFSRHPDSLLIWVAFLTVLIITGVLLEKPIGNRAVPLINLNTHPHFVAVLTDAVVVVVQQIRLDNLQSQGDL